MPRQAYIEVVSFRIRGPCGHELRDTLAFESPEEEDDALFTPEKYPKGLTGTCDVCGKEYKIPHKAIEALLKRR